MGWGACSPGKRLRRSGRWVESSVGVGRKVDGRDISLGQLTGSGKEGRGGTEDEPG